MGFRCLLPFLCLTLLCNSASAAQKKLPTPSEQGSAVKSDADVVVDLALASGLTHLLAGQESVGKAEENWEWPYEGVYRERGKIPLGYRVGGTSICAWAVAQMPDALQSEESAASLERAVRFILAALEQPSIQSGFSGGYDVRDWGLIYALNLFLRLEAQDAVPTAHREAVAERIPWLIQILQENSIPEVGGWNYARRAGGGEPAASSPFMTAPAILALWQAQAQGYDIDPAVVELALKSLVAAKVDDGVYSYTSRGGLAKVPGTIGRSPAVEVVLGLADLSSDKELRLAVGNFLEHWEELEKRRQKTGTHEGDYGIAPYYFYYAHYYAALAIEQLPEEQRADLRARYRERLFATMDRESLTFNDRVFARSSHFGTAMALLSLQQPHLPAPAGPEQAPED